MKVDHDTVSKIIQLIKASPRHEWTRNDYQTTYQPPVTKQFWHHSITGVVLIFHFKGTSLEFESGNFLQVEYALYSLERKPIKILSFDDESAVYFSFSEMLERGKSMLELTIDRNIDSYLSKKNKPESVDTRFDH
jgi:hypothetical protein